MLIKIQQVKRQELEECLYNINMAIIKLNNNALTSVTELPSGVGADPNTKIDLARLGLRVFANQNLAKQQSNTEASLFAYSLRVFRAIF